MASSSNQIPQLRLAVGDKMRKAGDACPAVVWNPSNISRDSLEVTYVASFEISEVTIFLEGRDIFIASHQRIALRIHRDLEELDV
jgi:hypothetical protein